jgi:hypothetical protein
MVRGFKVMLPLWCIEYFDIVRIPGIMLRYHYMTTINDIENIFLNHLSSFRLSPEVQHRNKCTLTQRPIDYLLVLVFSTPGLYSTPTHPSRTGMLDPI